MVDQILIISQSDAKSTRVIRNPFEMSGKLIGNMALILLNSGDFEKSWAILQLFLTNRNKISGFPTESALVSITQSCMKNKDLDKTMETLRLMSDLAYPKLDELVAQVKATMNPDDQQKLHLDDLL